MTAPQSIVYVVDDDSRIQEALHELLSSAGFSVLTFNNASEYLDASKLDMPGCLILDVELPGLNGLELQQHLSSAPHPPIVFITGHGDIPSSVRACKAGAVDFLTKPFNDVQLLGAVDDAIALDRAARLKRAELSGLQRRLAELTPREREVLPLVVSGLLNKQAAAELNISEITLQIHRSKIMQKMDAESFAALVRMAEALSIPITHARRSRV